MFGCIRSGLDCSNISSGTSSLQRKMHSKYHCQQSKTLCCSSGNTKIFLPCLSPCVRIGHIMLLPQHFVQGAVCGQNPHAVAELGTWGSCGFAVYSGGTQMRQRCRIGRPLRGRVVCGRVAWASCTCAVSCRAGLGMNPLRRIIRRRKELPPRS